MKLNNLPKILYFLWLMTATLNAKSDADSVFHYLNLDYPGLEKVKTAYSQGNMDLAKGELLKYFQNRNNRVFPGFRMEYDTSRAKQNASNVFLIKSSLNDFGKKIDWTKIHQDKEWQFTLNRMKWFLNFAGVYQRTNDKKYVRAWMDQIESWIELGNAGYPRTIDTGRRVENWTKSHWLFIHELKSPAVTPDFNAKMLSSMVEQAEYLYQPEHWRRYSNWGTFENSGLSLFVLMFPEFKRNEIWLKEIWFRMRFQLGESYHADGMHIEVSPSYHSHELEVWFNFLQLAEINKVNSTWNSQIPLPPLKSMFEKPARALLHFYKPTGLMPQVGDTDERNERSFLRKMGKYWDWPGFVYVATNGKSGQSPAKTSIAFPEGGYYIMRSGWGNKNLPFNEELYLLFDCGTNYPWHAHYDMLNIVATAYGYDLLKDPGRFTYTAGADRDYFKSTAAHNTIVIDAEDQLRSYSSPRAEWHSLASFDYVVGIQSSHPEVSHERSVFFVKPEYWIVVDRLTGSGNHKYDQFWHLNDKSLNNVQIGAGGRKVFAPHLNLVSLRDDLETSLDTGYISYRYRQKEEAPVVRFSLQGEPPIVWPTVLYPFKSSAPKMKVEQIWKKRHLENVDSSFAVTIRLSFAKSTDIFFEQQNMGSPFKSEVLETDAKMVFIRFDEKENIVEYRMVGGTYLKYCEKTVAQILGESADISVQNQNVELTGNFISGFQLQVQDTPEVFLNQIRIDVKRTDKTVSFNLMKDN